MSNRCCAYLPRGRYALGAFFVALASLAARPAEATPAYARRYGVACQTCHAPLPPRLNNVGIAFRKLGFRMPDADDEGRFTIKTVPAQSIGDAMSIAADVAARHDKEAAPGEGRTTFELGGPDVRTLKELMQYVLTTTQRRRLLVPLPFGLARLKASVLQFLPKPPLTPDQVELLRHDNVVSEAAANEGRTLAGLGVDPVAIEAVVPSYLWRFRKAGEFSKGLA